MPGGAAGPLPGGSARLTAEPVPVVLLSGFLGTGKTTLLKHWLENAEGRIGVVVNDVAAVNIDAKLVDSQQVGASGSADFIQMSNGCACCSLGDELLVSIYDLLQLSTEDRPFSQIVVELSGIAEPQRVRENFVQAAEMGSEVVEGLRLEKVVTLVDTSTFCTDYMEYKKLLERPDLVEDDGGASFEAASEQASPPLLARSRLRLGPAACCPERCAARVPARHQRCLEIRELRCFKQWLWAPRAVTDGCGSRDLRVASDLRVSLVRAPLALAQDLRQRAGARRPGGLRRAGARAGRLGALARAGAAQPPAPGRAPARGRLLRPCAALLGALPGAAAPRRPARGEGGGPPPQPAGAARLSAASGGPGRQALEGRGGPGQQAPEAAWLVPARRSGDLVLAEVRPPRGPSGQGPAGAARLPGALEAAVRLPMEAFGEGRGAARDAVLGRGGALEGGAAYLLLRPGPAGGRGTGGELADADVVGLARVSLAPLARPSASGRDAFLTYVIVRKDLRGRGLGGKMVGMVEAQAREAYDRMYLWTSPERRGFYSRLGFGEVVGWREGLFDTRRLGEMHQLSEATMLSPGQIVMAKSFRSPAA
ncbi:unnamed protein product [Prorocentrum cordatum]|uniref:N-acetyltransferase domain-containing protein n=1 Tax=Prorocentrum cordatum TaxID=2364126 RepID=A0ABN9VBW3_9DINO|nr:unnamed protein product [Polarella glacialis]